MSMMAIRERFSLAEKEKALAFKQRLARVASESSDKLSKARKRADDLAANGKLANAGASAASKIGIFAEAYAKKKLSSDNHKMVGPLAMAAEFGCLVAGFYSKRPADSMAWFAAAGGCNGASARFAIDLADKVVGVNSSS